MNFIHLVCGPCQLRGYPSWRQVRQTVRFPLPYVFILLVAVLSPSVEGWETWLLWQQNHQLTSVSRMRSMNWPAARERTAHLAISPLIPEDVSRSWVGRSNKSWNTKFTTRRPHVQLSNGKQRGTSRHVFRHRCPRVQGPASGTWCIVQRPDESSRVKAVVVTRLGGTFSSPSAACVFSWKTAGVRGSVRDTDACYGVWPPACRNAWFNAGKIGQMGSGTC